MQESTPAKNHIAVALPPWGTKWHILYTHIIANANVYVTYIIANANANIMWAMYIGPYS